MREDLFDGVRFTKSAKFYKEQLKRLMIKEDLKKNKKNNIPLRFRLQIIIDSIDCLMAEVPVKYSIKGQKLFKCLDNVLYELVKIREDLKE